MHDHFTLVPAPPPGRLATLLDVTLRDGGFEVDFHWPEDLFATVCACSAAMGVDIVELGYIGGVPLDHGVAAAGVGAYLMPHHITDARTRCGTTAAAMIHPTALTDTRLDLGAYVDAGLGMVRLVYHPDWFDAIAALCEHARTLGLTVSVNIALASRYEPGELAAHAARIAARMTPQILYIADTCSAMTPAEVRDLVAGVRAAVPADVAVGFHAHDFLNLAYANALAAVEAGASYLDCSLLGLGRGGGNLAAEPLLLRHRLPNAGAAAVAALLNCRSRLSAATRRNACSLVAAAVAALNLTPVEEHAVREFATAEQLDPDTAAVWLVTAAPRLSSLHPADLRTAWHESNRECLR